MTPRRWIARRSHFPLALPGEKLGEVLADNAFDAAATANLTYGAPVTVEPAPSRTNPALERVVERAVKAAARRAKAGPYGRFRRAPQPMKRTSHPDGDAA